MACTHRAGSRKSSTDGVVLASGRVPGLSGGVMYTPNLLRLTPIILAMPEVIFTVRDQHTVAQLMYILDKIRTTGLVLLCTVYSAAS